MPFDTPVESRAAGGGSAARLRVGLLLPDGLVVTDWVAHLIRRIQASDCAQLVLLVLDGSPPQPARRGRLRQLIAQPRDSAALAVQRLLEHALQRLGQARPGLPDAFAPVDMTAELADLPRLTVVPQRTRWSDHFAPADLDAIRGHRPDVLVRIGFRILRGGILKAARYGVWSYHHGDNSVNRGGPACYWESMEGWAATGCTLQVLGEDLDNGLVLARTWSSTVTSSVADNARSSYWKSLALLPRELARLHAQGERAYFAAARAAHPQWYSRRLYRAPTPAQLARLLAARLWRRVRVGLEVRTGFNQWTLLVHRSDSLSLAPWRYRRIVPPRDRFWADPFPLEHEGRCYLFFEELIFARGHGRIAAAELRADGTLSPPVTALETGVHLSYPFVFEHDGDVYMIPECRAERRVALYRCTRMPDQWTWVMDLMQGVDAVDATLHRHGGRWWLFINMVETPGSSRCDELFLFHAEEFRTSAWTPHPANPIVSDARRARPAGRLFEHEGRLYRPSQDCSRRYGWGLNLNWVRRLDARHYEEELVTTAEPSWAPDVRGIHTFNRAGHWHVIDADIRRSRWR